MIQIDLRLGGEPRYVLTNNPGEIMQIPAKIRKCAVFVGHEEKDDLKSFAGTAFFVAKQLVHDRFHVTYCVTAKHTLDKIRDRGGYKVWLRMNIAGGRAEWIETAHQDWVVHPTDANVDVAVLRFPLEDRYDHLAWPLWVIADQRRMELEGIGIGDEVFFTGLFSRRAGEERNIPIVRVGNIAAMPEEKILSGHWCMDAYLVESRSIGGLSGSPAFVHLGVARLINGEVRTFPSPIYYLMGLVHGHWDSPHSVLEPTEDDFRMNDEKVNMGIAIVVPASKIVEVIDHPSLAHLDEEATRRWREENGPTWDEVFWSKVKIGNIPAHTHAQASTASTSPVGPARAGPGSTGSSSQNTGTIPSS
jgi:hypothetical protein